MKEELLICPQRLINMLIVKGFVLIRSMMNQGITLTKLSDNFLPKSYCSNVILAYFEFGQMMVAAIAVGPLMDNQSSRTYYMLKNLQGF